MKELEANMEKIISHLSRSGFLGVLIFICAVTPLYAQSDCTGVATFSSVKYEGKVAGMDKFATVVDLTPASRCLVPMSFRYDITVTRPSGHQDSGSRDATLLAPGLLHQHKETLVTNRGLLERDPVSYNVSFKGSNFGPIISPSTTELSSGGTIEKRQQNLTCGPKIDITSIAADPTVQQLGRDDFIKVAWTLTSGIPSTCVTVTSYKVSVKVTHQNATCSGNLSAVTGKATQATVKAICPVEFPVDLGTITGIEATVASTLQAGTVPVLTTQKQGNF